MIFGLTYRVIHFKKLFNRSAWATTTTEPGIFTCLTNDAQFAQKRSKNGTESKGHYTPPFLSFRSDHFRSKSDSFPFPLRRMALKIGSSILSKNFHDIRTYISEFSFSKTVICERNYMASASLRQARQCDEGSGKTFLYIYYVQGIRLLKGTFKKEPSGNHAP